MIKAKQYFSGFELAHDTYNAISSASNGKIYYVLCSDSLTTGGKVYCYDPVTDDTHFLADLTTICGEKGTLAIPQGKSHVRFYEYQGKLYFATHMGVYEMMNGIERMPVNLVEGFSLYPGGHFLSYDLSSGKFKDLAIVPDGEGILAMIMDQERGHIYAITWPTGNFLHYDTHGNKIKNLGPISQRGEAGIPGEDYRVLCRSMFVDPKDGSAYFSTSEGNIFSYNPNSLSIKLLKKVNLKIDYFGIYDPSKPGSMGYNWRQILWHKTEEVAYGVHGNSGYLFRFDPRKQKLDLLDRITSEPSKRSGMFDQFSYGYLGLEFNKDEDTIYYLTGGPIYIDGQRVKGDESISKGGAKGIENLHLITYRIFDQIYTDHGPIFYKDGTRPTYVNSIALGTNGDIYTLARFHHNGKEIQDLVKIENPLMKET